MPVAMTTSRSSISRPSFCTVVLCALVVINLCAHWNLVDKINRTWSRTVDMAEQSSQHWPLLEYLHQNEQNNNGLVLGTVARGNRKYHHGSDPRPPLSALLALVDNNIEQQNSIANGPSPQQLYHHQHNASKFLSSMLHFAIIGHPKTATSTHIAWLASHPEIQAPIDEVTALRKGDPAKLVTKLYNELPAGQQYKRGYKSPHDIEYGTALDSIAKYWPNARLIVGVRHPMLWFQSFYNFRERNGYPMPPAESMANDCVHNSHSVCIHGARFHVNLNRLKKTNHTDSREIALLQINNNTIMRAMFEPQRPSPSKVFLYELSQLYDTNATRLDTYRHDLSSFLGLQQDLAPLQRNNSTAHKVSLFDICEKPKYNELRENLMKIARSASIWIREHFVQSDDVYVSSPDYFNELLLDWMNDPCEKPKTNDDVLTRI